MKIKYKRTKTISGLCEVWELPFSLYAIYNVKKGYMVVEVYIKDETIYIKYPYAQKTYKTYGEAISHLQHNNLIELDIKGVKQ